ncbi:GLD2 polymerase, partial [Heliornis fulica]|nr:GLD2 polymerase [Heliornis fulica]
NSTNLGCPHFVQNHQQQMNSFNKLPLNKPPTLLSQRQSIGMKIDGHNRVPQRLAYGNGSLVSVSDASMSFCGLKRPREQSIEQNVKRQRFQSRESEKTVVNQAVPLPEEHRRSFPGSINSPPRYVYCLPSFSSLQDSVETILPEAKDKLSQQILTLFQVCQQQTCDLNRKELCRTELQREIQQIFPQSRLYLVGSSLNGFGTRCSDGDLCLVIKEEPVSNLKHVKLKQKARYILSLIQKLFATKLSGYIERPQLIRAKVPIVRFRDKVRQVFCVEFDLNVNNIIGIRNTFLLRAYAYIENRVRPLVLVVKSWARFHDINDASRGTLSSYSIVLMVLHYLQTLPEPILPSLQKMYPESFHPAVQLNLVHRIASSVPPYLSKNGSSLGDLLLGFFKYYATEFDWNQQMISVREAKAVPRPDGAEWRNKFICIEEPFDGTNTARAVHEKQKFDVIKEEFQQCWQILRDTKDLTCIVPLRETTLKR